MEVRDPKNQSPFDIIANKTFETPMFFVTALINASDARDLLMYNRKPRPGRESTNRQPSPVVIESYKTDMLADEWGLSPQPVAFSQKQISEMSDEEVEEMIDGQQRLLALIEADKVRPGIEAPFTFAFDAPPKSKWLLDMGKKRNPGDFLRMQGEVNPGFLAKAAKMLYAMEEHAPFKSISLWRAVKLSPMQQAFFINKHPDLRHGLSVAKGTSPLFGAHVGAVLFYLVHREFGVYRAEELFRALSTGADISTSDPRLKVREFLAIQRRAKHKWDGFEQLAVLIAATNAWLSGQGDDYRARSVFNKLSTTFPKLLTADKMPRTTIVPGNDPKWDTAREPEAS